MPAAADAAAAAVRCSLRFPARCVSLSRVLAPLARHLMSTSSPASAATSKKEVLELTASSPSAPLALYNAGVATAAGAAAGASSGSPSGSARAHQSGAQGTATVTRTPIPILPAKPAAPAATAAAAAGASSSRGAMALGAAQHKMHGSGAAAGSASSSAYTPPRDLTVPAASSVLSSTTPSPISSSRLLLGLSAGAGSGAGAGGAAAASAMPPPLFSPMSAMLAAGAAADKNKDKDKAAGVSGFERTSKQLAAAHSAMTDVSATDAAQAAKKRKQPSSSSSTTAAPAPAPAAPPTPVAAPAPAPSSSGAQVTLALNKNALRGYGYLHSLTRWAEDIGFDAFRESLALCIGSFIDYDLIYPRVRNELEAAKAAHSSDPAIAGYPRLVNRRIFWSLCEEDAAPLNLSLKEVDERWGNAIKTKALSRFKKGDAQVTARLHVQRICIQGTGATSAGNSKKSAKGITHWRFVPFAGECKCGVLVRGAPKPPATEAQVQATLSQLYPIVYDAVKHYHDGAFTPLSTLALRLLATDASLCESALSVLGPPESFATVRPWQMSAKDFEEAGAKGEQVAKRTPFYTRATAEGAAASSGAAAAASSSSSSSARSASEKLQSAALLLEFVLHDVEWHNYVLKHQVRCEMIHASPITAVSSAGGVSTASALATEAAAELQIAWVPVAELSKRAAIEILARPDSEELEAQAPAPPPPPPAPASSSAAAKHKQIVELTDDDEEMSAVGGSSSSSGVAAPDAASGGPKKKAVPKAFSDKLARTALQQQQSGKTTSPPPRARTPAPRVPSPPPLPIPAAQTYLAPTAITPQSEFASRFRTFVHVVDVSPHDSSELMRKVTEPVRWQFLRMPNPGVLADFAAPRIGDLPHDFRDRFMLEAVAAGLEKRWFRVEELVDTVMAGRFDAILDCATDTPRTVAREAQSLRWRYRPVPGSYVDPRYRWMEQSLSQLFQDQASEYVRAQMVEKGLRLMRRQYLYAAKPLPHSGLGSAAAGKHRASSGSSASTPTSASSSGSSPSAAAAAASSSSAAAAASVPATPAHTPGFVHYQYMFLRLGPEEMEALYPQPLKRDERSTLEQAQEEAKRRAFEASAVPHTTIITQHTQPSPSPPAAAAAAAVPPSFSAKRAKTAHPSSGADGDEHKSAVRPPSVPYSLSPHSASSSRMDLVSEGEEVDDDEGQDAEGEESKSNPAAGGRPSTGSHSMRKPAAPTASSSFPHASSSS